MPTVKVKSPEQTLKKWENAFGKVSENYAMGVEAVNDFQQKAIAGQENYKRQMSNPAVLDRRATMLQKMPADKWKKNAMGKGSQNIVNGMEAAKPDYQAQMAKVLSVEGSVDLPARGIGAAANNARSLKMALALEQAKKDGKFA